MIFTASFKSLENHSDKVFNITITNAINGEQHKELKLAGQSPVIITTESDGLFSPIKSRNCTIRIVTDEIIPELYSPENQGTKVVVQEQYNQYPLFEGWLTPCAYNQGYSKALDELELEFVDCLSTLKNIDYTFIDSTPKIQTVQAILYNIWQKTGYSGNFYYHGYSLNKLLSQYKLSESNFMDDDEEHTPWKCYEVLEEICKFFGFSAVPYQNDVYLIDYETINNSNNIYSWRRIVNATSSEMVQKDSGLKTIDKDTYSGSEHQLSYDEVYNKISINDSIYEIEEITTDIFDTDNKVLINTAATTIGSSRFTHTHKGDEDKAWTVYWTKYLFSQNSNWTEKFYSVDTFQETVSYQNGIENTSYGPHDWVNGWGNTIFAMPERYWIFDEYAALTSTIDAKKVIAFNEMTKRKADSFQSEQQITDYLTSMYNCPVLIYEFPEEIQWKGVDGEGWSFICFKGDLWWQCDWSKTEVWLDDFFVCYPYDGIETIAGEYNKYTRGKNNADYNKGWPMLKAKLQIGNQYWNGEEWTTTETTFDIYYHKEMKSISSGDDEVLSYGAWQHPVFNTVITDNDMDYVHEKQKLIGEDCLAIPINQSLVGKLKFTLYPPKQAYVISLWADYDYTQLCPVVYMKDFELSYKYVPNNYDLVNIDEYKSDSDIIYTNIINENYVTEFDELELKINTAAENKPISRSYIMDDNSGYIVNINKNGNNKRQEHNLCNMYYDHYSSQKQVYDCQIHGYLHPGSLVSITALAGNYIVDSQEYDLKLNHNTVKLIEY